MHGDTCFGLAELRFLGGEFLDMMIDYVGERSSAILYSTLDDVKRMTKNEKVDRSFTKESSPDSNSI